MSTDATPTDHHSPGPATTTGRWLADDEPTPTRVAPLQFSPTCRHRLPNTIDEANEYPGPPARP